MRKSKYLKVFIAVLISIGIICVCYISSSTYKVDKKIETRATTKNELTDIQKANVAIASSGYWKGKNATEQHVFDEPLAKELLTFFKSENISSLIDLGAGMGKYSELFMSHGIFTSCYDGNPSTVEISEGRCSTVDLSKHINFMKHDWALCLEVGEHIPDEFEEVFIQNLDRINRKGMVVSWAVVGQGGHGHVNTHDNEYLKQKIMKMGYENDNGTEMILRNSSTYTWFKNTIMVFRKLESEINNKKIVIKWEYSDKQNELITSLVR